MAYGEPKVGVGGFIVHNHRLLLVRRAKPPEKDAWSIPGGKVEPGETLEDAVAREIAEEVGLRVEVERLLNLTQYFVPELGQHWLAPSFLCRVPGRRDVVPAVAEVREARWFAFDDLPTPLTRTTRAALAAYGRPGPVLSTVEHTQ